MYTKHALAEWLRRTKYQRTIMKIKVIHITPAGKYWSPELPEAVPLQRPQDVPKNAIWPSRGRPDPTSWGHLKMMSCGRPNRQFKGCPWEAVSGRS